MEPIKKSAPAKEAKKEAVGNVKLQSHTKYKTAPRIFQTCYFTHGQLFE